MPCSVRNFTIHIETQDPIGLNERGDKLQRAIYYTFPLKYYYGYYPYFSSGIGKLNVSFVPI